MSLAGQCDKQYIRKADYRQKRYRKLSVCLPQPFPNLIRRPVNGKHGDKQQDKIQCNIDTLPSSTPLSAPALQKCRKGPDKPSEARSARIK